MLYEFDQSHNTAGATKKICCVKGEDGVDCRIESRLFKKFHSGCKNFDDQAK